MVKWIKDTVAKRSRSPRGFGEHIRSYVEGRGVKDERTGVEGDLASILDGDLDEYLKAALARRS